MNLNLLPAGAGRAYWVLGDLYTILAGAADTGGAYALIHALVPAGGGPPPHIHRREDEAFYVLEGQLTFHADGQSFAASAGAWITLPQGSLHHFKNTGTTPAKMLILVNPSGLDQFFAEVGQPATDPTAAPPPVTPGDVERLLTAAPKYGLEIQLPPQ
ncbi:MAG: quercetin 2,3-dioxygenase [Planctomycetia bacterium]|nr:quercetin 2,3-dioxygenase [Planctomycetia bacterium]